jgi:hypothetical protein
MEEPDAPAAVGATVIRLADQIGLTPAGLRENRWEIEEAPASRAAAEASEAAAAVQAARIPSPPAVSVAPRERLRVVRDGVGG